jgi:hypothetical protein
VYANRRRVRGSYGKTLLRRRGEMVERSFVRCYETGGMRPTHLRGHENILKRQLIHVGASEKLARTPELWNETAFEQLVGNRPGNLVDEIGAQGWVCLKELDRFHLLG